MASASVQTSQSCHNCHTTNGPLSSCLQCNNFHFCDDCWSKWELHKPGMIGIGGRPHEKSNPDIVELYTRILSPKRSENDIDVQHQEDEETRWFGVDADQLEDYDRFATLMSEIHSPEFKNRLPRLVSFVGQTGAGKSSLIKMLIERIKTFKKDSTLPGVQFPSPVVSSARDDTRPTTAGVHLYLDPDSHATESPLLYADCEGLDGGEVIPRAHSSRMKSRQNRKKIFKKVRKIVWADREWKKQRGYAVKHLFPRLLYTFSDVVVFVLRNARTFEAKVVDKLLEWGASSINKSLNQPVLPHAIIVLNATDEVEESQWDIEKATAHLLNSVRNAVHQGKYQQYINIVGEGRHFKTTEQLLKSFYASISVVRVPSHQQGQFTLMDQQAKKLFETINGCSLASLESKRKIGMLAEAEQLQVYLQSAYDHFSGPSEGKPFDFIKEALKINPIPKTFGDNILNLATSVQQNAKDSPNQNTVQIFRTMTPLIASCIMLDCARQRRLGLPENLFNEYVKFCDSALLEFTMRHAPCEFLSKKHGRCHNMKSGHDPKGHQDKNGRIIGKGDYEPHPDESNFAQTWASEIKREFLQICQMPPHSVSPSLPSAYDAPKFHAENLVEFYTGTELLKCVSYLTCFSCLRELPEHALPCGHVLCLACVQDHGHQINSGAALELSSCPLSPYDQWDHPRRIDIKPAYAGDRILCLDGGGVRGIVELKTLRAIQSALGDNLPLYLFFDLIIGTSTGGIIALGLGVKNWSVDECINKFNILCNQAFTPRKLDGIPFLQQASWLHHGSKYETKPLETVLKQEFGDQPLFGGRANSTEMRMKVAVTCTTAVQQRAIVLANYNRPDRNTDHDKYITQRQNNRCIQPDQNPKKEPPYEFLRSNGVGNEFKVWEAARATSAAPPFFKKFRRESTKYEYLDGALYHNCPVKVAHHERKLIWGDLTNSSPDLILSIGTGQNSDEHTKTKDPSKLKEAYHRVKRTMIPKHARNLWKVVMDRIDSALQCEDIWNDYINTLSNPRELNRRIRINPILGMPVPELDAKGSLEELNQATDHYLENAEVKAQITEVCHRLIASTFFFEKIRSPNNQPVCRGKIIARISNRPAEMKALGTFIRDCYHEDFTPYFASYTSENIQQAQKIPIGEETLIRLCTTGLFISDEIEISGETKSDTYTIALCLSHQPYQSVSHAYLPISGFPRALFNEE